MILFSGKLIAALIAEKNPAAPPPITIMSFLEIIKMVNLI